MGDHQLLLDTNRFLRNVEQGESCWRYAGTNPTFFVNNRHTTPQRASYRLFVGPLRRTEKVVSFCGYKDCVNPKHLIVEETHKFCERRHPMEYFGGRWRCRECKRMHDASWHRLRRKRMQALRKTEQ